MPNRHLDQFSGALKSQGCHAALAYLNAGVPHRYTAIYRLHGGLLKNLLLVDKAGEVRPDFLAEVPLGDSFCQFVLRDGVFRTGDTVGDGRLNGHRYQGVLLSYSGVPVLMNGELWGTLCHFDVTAWPLADDEFSLLQEAAKALPPYLVEAAASATGG